jgi:hypothetical protein
MRGRALLNDKQRKAMLAYKSNVGELYRTVDWIRDSIIDEQRDGIEKAIGSLRAQLAELERAIMRNRP